MLEAIGSREESSHRSLLRSMHRIIAKSASNIPGVKTAQVNTLNVYDILNAGTARNRKGCCQQD